MNYWAILAAGVVSMILGMFWYSPSVFGTTWMKLAGIDMKKAAAAQKKGMKCMGGQIVAAFIATLVTAYVLSKLVTMFGYSTAGEALGLAFWIWLGFVGTTTLSSVLWEGKPQQLWWLNNAHNFINLAIAALIVTLWV